MADFSFPPPAPNSWATWNVTFESGSIATDRDLDKATLEQSITDFAVKGDAEGITCSPEFFWKDIDGRHSQLNVNLSCKSASGTNLAKRIVVRPPGSAKPPAGRVSIAELAVRE